MLVGALMNMICEVKDIRGKKGIKLRVREKGPEDAYLKSPKSRDLFATQCPVEPEIWGIFDRREVR